MKKIIILFFVCTNLVFGFSQNFLFQTDKQLNKSQYTLSTDLEELLEPVFYIKLPNRILEIEKTNLVYHNETNFTVSGKLKNEPYFFFLSKQDDTYLASLKENGVVHTFNKELENDFQFIYTMNGMENFNCNTQSEEGAQENEYFEEAPLYEDNSEKKGISYKSTNENSGCESDNCQLRVLVLYTPKLESEKGSSTIIAQANNSIAELNQSFVNSGVNQTAVLAGVEQMFSSSGFEKNGPFAPLIDGTEALKKIVNRNDGYVDYHINYTRKEKEADIVVVFHFYAMDGIAGQASSIGGHRDSIPCAVMRFKKVEEGVVFTHELGHLLGLRHQSDVKISPYAKGHGYISSNNYGSIMVDGSFSGNRVLFWSSPNVTVGSSSVPLGNNIESNSVEVLNSSIPIANGFREIGYNLNLSSLSGFVNTNYHRINDINFYDSSIDANSCLFLKAGNEISLTGELSLKNYFHGLIGDPYCSDGVIVNSQFFGKTKKKVLDPKDTDNFSLYPNPAQLNGTVKIKSSESESVYEFKIFDLNGSFVRTLRPNDENSCSLNEINSGFYFVRIVKDGVVVDNIKLIINEH